MSQLIMLDGNTAALRAHEAQQFNESEWEIEERESKESAARYQAMRRDEGDCANAAISGSGLGDACEIIANELADFNGSLEEYNEIKTRAIDALLDGIHEEQRYKSANP